MAPPVLHIYQANVETELHTDASSYGIAPILPQRSLDDLEKFYPIYYCSRKILVVEQKYTSCALEVLAIVKALLKCRIYLVGRPFKIVTDCSAFQMTKKKKKELITRIAK